MINPRVLERTAGTRFIPGNRVEVFYDTGEVFQDMFLEISRATHSVCLIFYIFRDDATGRDLADALMHKAREGVRVCLLYDHFGSLFTPRRFWRALEDAGVEVRASRPFAWGAPGDYVRRDHRKLLVIDGAVAYTGGLNVADEYRRRIFRRRRKGWRDTGVKIEGPAAARLHEIFGEAWQFWKGGPLSPAPGETVSFADGLRVMPVFASSSRARRRMRKLLHLSIRGAEKSIDLTTAYFTPSRRMLQILDEAVRRGVRVRLLLPAHSDVLAAKYAARAFFGQLLSSGIEIYLYQESVLHAKSYVFDGVFSIVGSANLDFLSLRRNDEGNAGVYDEGFARAMLEMFERDLARSERIDAAAWSRRPLHEKIMEHFFALFRRRL